MSIVLAYDESPHGRAALERAKHEAQSHGTRLHVVRYIGHASESRSRLEAEQTQADELEQRLEELREQLASEGVDASVEVRHGSEQGVAQGLIETAEREAADMLVLGMRRRSPVGKLLLGSVVQEVLLDADCAVLAVKAPSD